MRMLMAKTALDGHWRGTNSVTRAFRDAGIEVVFAGMARPEEVATAVVDEDVDLVGLNVGGRVEVAERFVKAIRAVRPDVPIMAGGTIPPWAARRLEKQGISVHPPGSSLAEIVEEGRAMARQAAEGA